MGDEKKRMPVSYVGKMIKDAREARNLSINEIVDEIHRPEVTAELWKKWENGKEFPNLDCIYILAEKLELNPNEMVANKNTIIKESIHEVNWAKRRVGAYAFDILHTWVFVGVKLIGIVLVFLLLYYLIMFMNLMLGDPGGIQEQMVVNIIDNTAERYIPSTDNQTITDNSVN